MLCETGPWSDQDSVLFVSRYINSNWFLRKWGGGAEITECTVMKRVLSKLIAVVYHYHSLFKPFLFFWGGGGSIDLSAMFNHMSALEIDCTRLDIMI